MTQVRVNLVSISSTKQEMLFAKLPESHPRWPLRTTLIQGKAEGSDLSRAMQNIVRQQMNLTLPDSALVLRELPLTHEGKAVHSGLPFKSHYLEVAPIYLKAHPPQCADGSEVVWRDLTDVQTAIKETPEIFTPSTKAFLDWLFVNYDKW